MRSREIIREIKKLMDEVDPTGMGSPIGVSVEITLARYCCYIYNIDKYSCDIAEVKFRKRTKEELENRRKLRMAKTICLFCGGGMYSHSLHNLQSISKNKCSKCKKDREE